jgi:hypothetical protein
VFPLNSSPGPRSGDQYSIHAADPDRRLTTARDDAGGGGVQAEDLKDYTKGQVVSGVYWMPDGRSFLVAKTARAKKSGRSGRFRSTGASRSSWIGQIGDKFPWGSFRPDLQQMAVTTFEPAPKSRTEVWALDHFPTGSRRQGGTVETAACLARAECSRLVDMRPLRPGREAQLGEHTTAIVAPQVPQRGVPSE